MKVFGIELNTQWIYVFLLTIAIAYLIGLMITNIVDKKLGNIAIRMPKIKLPQPPQIVFKISQDAKHRIKVESYSNQKKRKKDPKESFMSVQFDNGELPSSSEKSTRTDEMDINVQPIDQPIIIETRTPTTQLPKVGCTTDADCNVVNGDGKNVCKADGTCYCLSGSGLFCHYGPTKFTDPKDMTPKELNRFKWKYRNNMTLQDYKNWLLLYRTDPENLRQHHRKNLQILLRGGQLSEKHVPAIRIKPPTNASDYFAKMYKGGRISVHFPNNDSPLVGYNYTKYIDFIPPENTASSWITGVVDLYKDRKDDARALDWYVRPDAIIGEEEKSVGDTYQKYVRKHHDLSDLRKIGKVTSLAERRIRQDNNLKTFESRDPNVNRIDF